MNTNIDDHRNPSLEQDGDSRKIFSITTPLRTNASGGKEILYSYNEAIRVSISMPANYAFRDTNSFHCNRKSQLNPDESRRHSVIWTI